MPITEKEFITGFLSKTLNMDEDGVASLYNEDGTGLKDESLESVLNRDVERVKSLKPDTKKLFDDGYKKAQSETLSRFEKEFKEKFKFDSDKQGIDLITEYVASQGKKGNALDEDAVKRHPLFIQLQDAKQKEVEAAIKAEQDKFNSYVSEQKKKETFSTVSNKALDVFKGLKPILSSDAEKARNQESILLRDLQQYDFEDQNGEIVVLKEGKVLTDAHGNRVKFNSLVKSTADKYYDFHKAEERSAPGNGKETTKTTTATDFQFEVPKNEEEYVQMITDVKRPYAERAAIQEAYQKSKGLETQKT